MKRSFPNPGRQRGVALVIALLLLLVMSVLGVSSLRSSLLEERMSGAMFDRSLSFQGTEAALREAEALLVVNPPPSFPASGCTNGLCSTPDPAAVDRWRDPAFVGWRTATVTLGAPAVTPQFFVENMGDGPNWPGCEQEIPVSPLCRSPRYRVTARSGDPTQGRSLVVLQSSFATP